MAAWLRALITITFVAVVAVSFFSYPFIRQSSSQAVEDVLDVNINARQISSFKIGNRDQKVFGALEFMGGLELLADTSHFGGVSGLSVSKDGASFVAITDTGFWVQGRLDRDERSRLSGLSSIKMTSMLSETGETVVGKQQADAEGLSPSPNGYFVSFERDNRVVEFATAGGLFNAVPRRFGPSFSGLGLRGNKGLEAVALVPIGNPLNRTGGITTLVSAERSLNDAGNIRAFLVTAGNREEFAITYDDEFDVTDAAVLPEGDVLLLERRFNMASGVAMRIRRIAANEIKAGATITGMVLMQADMSYQIDNMEGMSIRQNDQGETIITLISDDNFSILQRNILLEFKLLDGDFQVNPERRPQE